MTPFWFRHQVGIVVFVGILLLIALSNLLALRRLKRYPVPMRFPRVSVLIPVRNEQAVIGDCLRSLLAQDYSDFEILVLDDGSVDGTAELLAELDHAHDRLRVLTGRPLPEGWLGKHWACQQLAEAASGELLLFTDADTLHHPQMLQAGVAALCAERADLLSGFLRQRLLTWGERLTIPAVFWCFFSFLPIALARRVRAPGLSLTNGQWMFFRRTAYEAVGGHAAVRTSPIDDIALGRRVKEHRLRWRVVDAGELVCCRMYPGFRGALEGFTKNLFAVFDFRLAEYLFVWLWVLLISEEPLLVLALRALGLGSQTFAVWPAVLAVAEMLALWGIVMARLRFPLYLAFLYPIHVLLLVFIAVRSMLWTATGRATWKGRNLPRQRVRWI